MPLGSLFSSNKKTSSTTQESSTVQSLAEEAQGFSLGDIGSGKKSNVELTIQTTDGNAVSDALEFAAGATIVSTGQSSAARTEALEFGAGAIDVVGENTSDVLGLAAGSILSVLAVTEDSLEFAAGAFQEGNKQALVGIEKSAEVLGEVNQTLESSLQRAEVAQNNALEFAAGNLEQQAKFAGDALTVIDSATTKASQAAQASKEKDLAFAAGVLQTTLGSFNQANQENISALSAAQSETISALNQASKSESAQSFDKLVEAGTFAGAALLGLLVLSQIRK